MIVFNSNTYVTSIGDIPFMKPFFLNTEQRLAVLNEEVDLSTLTEDKMRKLFTATDMYAIERNTNTLLQNNNLLASLCFKPSDCLYANGGVGFIDVNTVTIDSVCPNEDTIIIWLIDDNNDASKTNNMLKVNTVNILHAMERVLPYATIKTLPQFKQAVACH